MGLWRNDPIQLPIHVIYIIINDNADFSQVTIINFQNFVTQSSGVHCPGIQQYQVIDDLI